MCRKGQKKSISLMNKSKMLVTSKIIFCLYKNSEG